MSATKGPDTINDNLTLATTTKSPRTARFAEATAVYSPVSPAAPPAFDFCRSQTQSYRPEPQVADSESIRKSDYSVMMEGTDAGRLPQGRVSSPLRSAMKTPSQPSKQVMSPTFHEEEILEKADLHTDREQAKDLKIKTRVRAAKFFLRGVGFSCSLIVISMLATVFTIVRATQNIPPRTVGSKQVTPWAPNQQSWPQITVLSIACVSLVITIAIFYGYFRGGHARAERTGIYYTFFSIATFGFSIAMWIVGAAVLQSSKNSGGGQDMWGWACNDNTRSKVYQAEVDYALTCRLQNWSLVCCIIEIVVEVITIAVYAIIFHRFYSKRRLRKSMHARDQARSDLYLAQLRAQSAPNTPGWNKLRHRDQDDHVDLEAGHGSTPVSYPDSAVAQAKPFVLQPAPLSTRALQRQAADASPVSPVSPISPISPQSTAGETRQAHVVAAPGEKTYDDVPIPGGYGGH